MSRLVGYTSDQIPQVWDSVQPHIKKALDGGSNYTEQDIRLGLCCSTMQLWCWVGDNIEAALVTMIQTKKGIKFCLYLALGGAKMNEWAGHMHIVEKWAKEAGCTEMRIYGRHGWAKPFGFNIDYTKMSKQI